MVVGSDRTLTVPHPAILAHRVDESDRFTSVRSVVAASSPYTFVSWLRCMFNATKLRLPDIFFVRSIGSTGGEFLIPLRNRIKTEKTFPRPDTPDLCPTSATTPSPWCQGPEESMRLLVDVAAGSRVKLMASHSLGGAFTATPDQGCLEVALRRMFHPYAQGQRYAASLRRVAVDGSR